MIVTTVIKKFYGKCSVGAVLESILFSAYCTLLTLGVTKLRLASRMRLFEPSHAALRTFACGSSSFPKNYICGIVVSGVTDRGQAPPLASQS